MPEFNEGKPRFNSPEFSYVPGGLFFQLLRWAGLSDSALLNVRQRVIIIALLAWLPLLVLSAVDGQILGGSAAVPFLLDVEVHIRFLVALPLLIVAEVKMHQRVPHLLQQFLERDFIPENSMARFRAAVMSAFRLRISVTADVLLIVVVYGIGILIVWRHYLAIDAATWYATPSADGSTLTLAGWWYGYVSLPIVQFLLLRWYWRLLVWARLLWQVSRIELNLIPTHPDRAAGLGFLATTIRIFTMLAVAHGTLMAGQIASRIFFTGAALPEFADQVFVVTAFMLCVILGPLLFFAPQLAAAKRGGLLKYGALAERYVREFDAKWLRGGAPANQALVGSADIQSLADLSVSYNVVRTMRFSPIDMQAVVGLAAATLIPIAPLLLSMMPKEELLKKLLGILF